MVENPCVLADETSTVTVRGYRHRTTIPIAIFDELKLKDKDTLRWVLLTNGTLIVYKTEKKKGLEVKCPTRKLTPAS